MVALGMGRLIKGTWYTVTLGYGQFNDTWYMVALGYRYIKDTCKH